jgi:hypothetical protein
LYRVSRFETSKTNNSYPKLSTHQM